MKREGIGKKKKEVREKERGENRRKGELAPILWAGGTDAPRAYNNPMSRSSNVTT